MLYLFSKLSFFRRRDAAQSLTEPYLAYLIFSRSQHLKTFEGKIFINLICFTLLYAAGR